MSAEATRFAANSILSPWTSAWRHRQVLYRLVERDVRTRFRGSILGSSWIALIPLTMLALYTIVFGLLIRPQWQAAIKDPLYIPFIYFSGLILFDFAMECIMRSPPLMREHQSYIKKILFPVELLAWVVVLSSGFRLLISLGLLFGFYFAVIGIPPASVLALPLLVIPLGILTLGLIWLLSSMAVYIRDIGHMVTAITPIIMFLTPVFYPVSAAPQYLRSLFYINPLTFPIEAMRGILFRQIWPSADAVAWYFLAAFVVAWTGFSVFMKLRPGFADVL